MKRLLFTTATLGFFALSTNAQQCVDDFIPVSGSTFGIRNGEGSLFTADCTGLLQTITLATTYSYAEGNAPFGIDLKDFETNESLGLANFGGVPFFMANDFMNASGFVADFSYLNLTLEEGKQYYWILLSDIDDYIMVNSENATGSEENLLFSDGAVISFIALSNFTVIIEEVVEPAYTDIPDLKFEQRLIALEIDDVEDGKVLTSAIRGITELYVDSKEIKDLTGIEDFTALEILDCQNNQLKSLDLSKNMALKKLWCNNNELMELDLSKNTALEELFCIGNPDLILLNLQNGNNSNVSNMYVGGSPKLNCIQVDLEHAAYLADWNVEGILLNSFCVYPVTFMNDTWVNGQPEITKSLHVRGELTLTEDIEVRSIMLVEDGKITIPDGFTLTIGDGPIYITGSTTENFIVESGGALIQSHLSPNTAPITVKRNSSVDFLLKKNDNVLWSSPVADQKIFDFSPETAIASFWVYDEPTNQYKSLNNSLGAGWENTATFTAGKGYGIRADKDLQAQ